MVYAQGESSSSSPSSTGGPEDGSSPSGESSPSELDGSSPQPPRPTPVNGPKGPNGGPDNGPNDDSTRRPRPEPTTTNRQTAL